MTRLKAHALWGVAVVCLLLAGAWVLKPAGTARGAEPVQLIPREVLFGNPDRSAVSLSSDGRYIAFMAPWHGVMNVWVAAVDAPDDAKPVTQDQGRGIAGYLWTFSPGRLLYVQDRDGDENWHVYSVDVDTGEATNLTPVAGVQAQLLSVSPERPDEVLVRLNDRVPVFHDVYAVDLVTGDRTLVYQNDEGFVGFLPDAHHVLRYAFAVTPDGGGVILAREDDQWVPIDVVGPDDILTTSLITLNRAGDALYLIDSRDGDTAVLVRRDLATGEERIVYEDPQADTELVLLDPATWEAQAAASNYDRRRWEIMDAGIAEDFAFLQSVADGDLHVVSRTQADDLWIVAYEMDVSPTRLYIYDRNAREVRFLFTNRSELEKYTLAPMQPVIIPARDGMALVSYLTLPPWVETSVGDERVTEPLPMVLVVHGGPWARDVWGYNAEHQWLANRGYAVLSVNFRGSTGLGKSFTNAGNREWGGKMHNDLIDAVDWAVAQGIADPDRVAIYGGSYGGYAVLAGLTMTPEVFAAGVDIVGPSNLVTLLESVPPYWEPQIELYTTRVGDHRTEEGRAFLTERSPLTYVDQIRKPLLIGQGANDPRVKQAESDQIVEAMLARSIPVTYVLYPDEGHGFARPENTLSFYAVAEAFLAEHVGGRMEPIGSGLQGSSMVVVEGAEHIPGLAEALSERGE